MQLHIRGVPAILLIVIVGAFTGWRILTARADLQDGAAEELAQWIRAEYARKQMQGVSDASQMSPAKVDSILATQHVTFPSLEARGKPDEMIVRAEFLIDGKAPADGENVRYYVMRYSTLTGWRMTRETHALSYYLKLF